MLRNSIGYTSREELIIFPGEQHGNRYPFFPPLGHQRKELFGILWDAFFRGHNQEIDIRFSPDVIPPHRASVKNEGYEVVFENGPKIGRGFGEDLFGIFRYCAHFLTPKRDCLQKNCE